MYKTFDSHSLNLSTTRCDRILTRRQLGHHVSGDVLDVLPISDVLGYSQQNVTCERERVASDYNSSDVKAASSYLDLRGGGCLAPLSFLPAAPVPVPDAASELDGPLDS